MTHPVSSLPLFQVYWFIIMLKRPKTTINRCSSLPENGQMTFTVQMCCLISTLESFPVVTSLSLPPSSYVALTRTRSQSTWQAHVAGSSVFQQWRLEIHVHDTSCHSLICLQLHWLWYFTRDQVMLRLNHCCNCADRFYHCLCSLVGQFGAKLQI